MHRWNLMPSSFSALFIFLPSKHKFNLAIWFSIARIALAHAGVHWFDISSISDLKSVFFCSSWSTFFKWLHIVTKALIIKLIVASILIFNQISFLFKKITTFLVPRPLWSQAQKIFAFVYSILLNDRASSCVHQKIKIILASLWNSNNCLLDGVQNICGGELLKQIH